MASDPQRFSGKVVPSDIEIRRNHFYKPLTWKGAGWAIKNLFELKNARRVLVEGNVFENNWAEAPDRLRGRDEETVNQGGRCDWCVTSDVTWRCNRVINSPGGFNLAALTIPMAAAERRHGGWSLSTPPSKRSDWRPSRNRTNLPDPRRRHLSHHRPQHGHG